MSYSEWADFVYYDIGGIASYNSIVYQALQANRNVVPTTLAPNWQLLPAPAGAGVSSLETLTGAITLSSPTATFTTAGNNIELTIQYPVPPAVVNSLNTESGAVVLQSADATFTPQGGGVLDMAINFPAPPPTTSLQGLTNAITLSSPTATFTNVGQDIQMAIQYPVIPPTTSLQGLTNAITLSSPTATFTNVGQDIQMAIQYPTPPLAVDSLNGLTGGLTLQSPDGSITITPNGPTIDLQVGTPSFDFEGIQNKLGIIPALPHTSDTVALAVNNDLTPPTAIVPDATAPTSSTTPLGALCWLYTKPVSNAGFNWYMYNPRFSVGIWSALIPYVPTNRVLLNGVFYECILANTNQTPPNVLYWIVISPAVLPPLPYTKYSSNPAQERIQSVWALVQPAVNTNIYTAGIVALNLYSFDDANPPTTSFYNTRWAYSNSAGINSGQSGTNLYAGYTYLLYAYDAPRITNQTGVGQPDIQDWGLRDPYDIYTDVHHIPLQNCVLAFNPWTNGTNYQTWTTTGLYTNAQTVIYSGFGGTPNGIFYTAVGTVPTNTPPVSATGVPSVFWTAISPQPSSYASQPIVAMNLNGINGTAVGWTAGPLLRVLSMGYTTGNNPYTQTSGVRYVLN